MKDLLLSVVIPAHNEELRIGSTLKKVEAYLSARAVPFEIAVIDDGSRDRTFEIAKAFAGSAGPGCPVRLYQNERRRGKGFGVRRGMLEARAPFALLTDADLSAPIEELPKLEREVISGDQDIAFGSRAAEGARVEIHQSWFRENSGKIFNRLVRLLTSLPYWDTQCGFKLFRMERCRKLFQKQTIHDFGFDVEILYLARKNDLRMKEVPVVWRHATGSKVRLAPDALAMLLDLLKIRWNDWRGVYDQLTSDS